MGDIRAGLDELKLDVALFADVKYYVSGEGDPKILSLLQKGGASRSNFFSDLVTHLIAGYEVLENDISVAKDLYEIPAVTQDWILYSARCKKLLPTKYFSPESEQLFSTVRACVSQVSRADSKALWAMITFQGGKCQLRLDRYCTHLITGKAGGAKYDAAMRFENHHVQIVTPDWVTECCKKGSLMSEVEYHPRLLIYPSPNSSTALITGFMDEDGENNPSQEEQDRTKAMLEQLKQRMPWNQPHTSASSSGAPSQSANATSGTVAPASIASTASGVQQQAQMQTSQNSQQQPQYSRPGPTSNLSNYIPAASPAVSNANMPNQNNWHAQSTAASTTAQMKPQIQQAELSQQQQPLQQQVNVQQVNLQQQQQVNMQQAQQQMIHHQQQQQTQLSQQQIVQQQQQMNHQQLPQQNFTQQQQQAQQSQQQMLNSQVSPQLTAQPVAQQQTLNQQTLMTQQPQQQINMQIPQHQLAVQQQLLSPQKQQQQLSQHQLMQQQQQLNQQPQQQLVSQQQLSQQPQQQLVSQQQLNQQPQQQIVSQQQQMNQQSQQQQLVSQQQSQQPQQSPQLLQQQQIQQQIVQQQQHQLAQPQQVVQQQPQQQPQQLTPEQRQQLHLLQQQQQQQQKIQQISQQLQQSAPQSSQQFVIRDGQLQQQSPNQQLINTNQQSFLVQRDPQWQQQQYHLQLRQQQQQAQQQLGQQRPVGQWTQQPPQPPRQLIQLDAQTHQQLQQMDPQQRAQFIQKIQKQRTLLIQRQMQNRQAQQGGPHIAVIRSPGKPGQPGLQWVQQPRAPMMGPQVATVPGQKPMHPGVQPPGLTSINAPNQVIVQSGQAVQGPQPAPGQPFQQVQPLIPQQMAQLHLQKQQQMARLQLQHLQQQQAQQAQQQQQQQQQQSPAGPQQEPPLTPLSVNSQMPPDQQLVVNAKTKTALANMLTNRLQGGTTEGSAAGQLRLMTAQHRPPPPPSQDPQLLAAYQRRSLGNITNGAPPGAPIKMQYAPTMQQPKAQFYGHNPNLKLPPDLFLLGCIFVIVEYDVTLSNDVARWKQIIERHGGEVEPQYCPRTTHVLAVTQKHPVVVQALREGKRCVSADWLSDVVTKQQVLPPWHALHLPISFSLNELPCTKQIVSSSGFEDEEKVKVIVMLELLGAKYTKYFSRQNTMLICKRTEGQKYKKAREWQIPVVNAQWLTDLMCGQRGALHQTDAPKYQHFSLANPFRLDYSLVPHLMAAWKMPINITQESYDKVKQVGQGPNAMRKYKKPRLEEPLMNKEPHLLGLEEPIVISNPDPPTGEKQPKILFSGINPAKHAKRIRELGGALASSWRDATHLVMNTPLRTVKLLCCLSRCKYIVNVQWLLDCFAKNTFVDEVSYTLADTEFEKSYNCNIEKALTSPNRGSVLKGKIFYSTPSVIPSPSALAEIIESAGGMMEKNRRSVAQIQEMNATKLTYIIITHDSDIHLLADVLRAEISVFNAEIVLGAVSRQHFQIDGNQL